METPPTPASPVTPSARVTGVWTTPDGPLPTLTQLFELTAHGPDTFVGVGPRYPWGGLYGGQIVAQALRAAWATVAEDFAVHSLHAYFMRRGDDAAPVRYEVDRSRDGRTYCTRRVVARQASGELLSLSASFAKPEGGPSEQGSAAGTLLAVDPEAAHDASWSPIFQRAQPPGSRGRGRMASWFRARGAADLTPTEAADPILGACFLAYTSDDLPTEAVVTLHPQRPAQDLEDPAWDHPSAWDQFWNASLDHSIWFHAPVRADEWLLHELTCDAFSATRGVAIGRVYRTDGTLVATLAQEALVRVADG